MHGKFLEITIVLSVVSILVDWYVYNGLKTLLSGYSSHVHRVVLWSFLLINLSTLLLLCLAFTVFSSPKGMMPFHQWVVSFFLTLFFTKLLFVVVLLVGDIYRAGEGSVNALRGHKQSNGSYVPSRRKFVSELAVLIAALPFSGFVYAMFRGKYDYKVHRHVLYFDDLPEAFNGFTITQLSDIHSGSFDNKSAVQRGIDLANSQKSDLFVFTGDLVNNGAWEIEPYIDQFKQLKAPFGQYSILGNHDDGDYLEWRSPAEKEANLEKLKAHHKSLGYRLLLDENITLEKNGQEIVLIGVQNWGRGFIQKGNLSKALNGVVNKDFKILLSHDPTHWEEIVRHHPSNVHLTLSGHTHGAQFGVETAGFRWSPVQYRYLDWAGLLVENGRHLYVNRGFGFLAFSGRLGIWPEITVIELRRNKA